MSLAKALNDSSTNGNFNGPSNGSGEYSTTVSFDTTDTGSKEISGVETVNIILIIVTVWILLCLIIYGTKTRRWTKKASDSSLNNGTIFIACFVAILLALPRLALTETLYRVHDFDDLQCEIVGDISKGAFAVYTYSVYTFLWIKQRLIYKHPYVKDRVSKCVNIFSRGFLVLLTVLFLGVTSIYVVPKSYIGGRYGCIYAQNLGHEIIGKVERSSILAVAWIILQISVLTLSIYPAIQVRKKTREELGLEEGNNAKNFCTSKSNNLWNKIIPNDPYVCSSPIQMSISRTVLCSIIIIVTDLVAIIVDITAVSMTAPLAAGQSLYDISALINAFCMLGTFTFFGPALTVCFPKFSKVRETIKRRKTIKSPPEQVSSNITIEEVIE